MNCRSKEVFIQKHYSLEHVMLDVTRSTEMCSHRSQQPLLLFCFSMNSQDYGKGAFRNYSLFSYVIAYHGNF